MQNTLKNIQTMNACRARKWKSRKKHNNYRTMDWWRELTWTRHVRWYTNTNLKHFLKIYPNRGLVFAVKWTCSHFQQKKVFFIWILGIFWLHRLSFPFAILIVSILLHPIHCLFEEGVSKVFFSIFFNECLIHLQKMKPNYKLVQKTRRTITNSLTYTYSFNRFHPFVPRMPSAT